MDLSPAETDLVHLLRSMGSDPLHLGFTCTGNGVSFALVSEETGPITGWGASVEAAIANAYRIPEPPQPTRLSIVGGRDRQGPPS